MIGTFSMRVTSQPLIERARFDSWTRSQGKDSGCSGDMLVALSDYRCRHHGRLAERECGGLENRGCVKAHGSSILSPSAKGWSLKTE